VTLFRSDELQSVGEFFGSRYGREAPEPHEVNAWRLAETTQMMNSAPFAITNYFKVADKDGDLVRIKPFVFQAILSVCLESQRRRGLAQRVLEDKSRQTGGTTWCLGEALFNSLHPNHKSIVLVNDEDVAMAKATVLAGMVNSLPMHMQPKRRIQNLKHLFFDNPNPKERIYDPGLNSEIQITVPSGMRGTTPHLVIISEYAFMDDNRKEEVNTGLLSAMGLRKASCVIIDTTPNGMGDEYHTLVMEAVEANPKWVRRLETTVNITAADVFAGKLGEPERPDAGWVLAYSPFFTHDEYTTKNENPRGEYERISKSQLGDFLTDVCNNPKYGRESEMRLQEMGVSPYRLYWRRKKIDSFQQASQELKLLVFDQEYSTCIAAGQRVSTTLGLVKIEDVTIGMQCPTGEVIDVLAPGIKQVIELRTAGGRRLICTPNHWVFTTDGEVQAENLIGKHIILQPPIFAEHPYELQYTGFARTKISLEITKDWARFLGYFMSDGCYYGSTITIANDIKDQDLIDDQADLIRVLFGLDVKYRKIGKCINVLASSNALTPLFSHLGIMETFDKDGIERHRRIPSVPECIWRSPKSHVREFLRAYFSGDGYRSVDGQIVKAFSSKRSLMESVQHLLLGFGVHSYIAMCKKKKPDGGVYVGYELRLNVNASAVYMREVGFTSKRKSERPRIARPHGGRSGRSPLVDANHDEVIEICDVGLAPVYDLTIGDRHKYCVNGLSVHNTVSESFVNYEKSPFDRDCLTAVVKHGQEPIARGILREEGGKIGIDTTFNSDWQELRIYAPPESSEQYAIGVDTGGIRYGSLDADAWVAQVLRARDFKVVATYEARVDEFTFCDQLMLLYKWYGYAYTCVELQASGYAVVRRLVDAGMRNYYQWKRLDVDFPEPGEKVYPGWETTFKTRPIMDDWLVSTICHRDPMTGKPEPTVIVPDLKTLSELQSVRRTTSGAIKNDNGHDDHCIAGESLITTREGVKRADQIEEGDEVLTHKGRFRKVLATSRREATVAVVRTVGVLDTKITSNHPLWVSRYRLNGIGQRVVEETSWLTLDEIPSRDGAIVRRGVLAKCAYPQETNDLQRIDLAPFSSGSYSVDMFDRLVAMTYNGTRVNPKQNVISRYLEMSDELAFMLGYFAAEGSVGHHSVTFSSHTDEMSLQEFTMAYFRGLGCKPALYHDTANGSSVRVASVPLRGFFSQFGTGSEKAYPAWCSELPTGRQWNILLGHLAGDGCFTSGRGIKVGTISPNLAFQLLGMARRCGLAPTIRMAANRGRWAGKGLNPRDQYILSFNITDAQAILSKLPMQVWWSKSITVPSTPKSQHRNTLPMDGGALHPIRGWKQTGTVEPVYNFFVEEDNSYCVNGLTVHNCDALCLAMIAVSDPWSGINRKPKEERAVEQVSNFDALGPRRWRSPGAVAAQRRSRNEPDLAQM
jgi:intein/homing endonuclease